MNYYRSSVGSDEYSKAYTYTVNNVSKADNADSYFENNYNLTNENIIVGSYVTGGSKMFCNATNFNGTVNLGANMTNAYRMFSNCKNFNQSVTIPANVDSCYAMFADAILLNQEVKFAGNNYNNLSCMDMFNQCSSFNKPITLPEGVTLCRNMFMDSGFNQSIVIPATVTDCYRMFEGSPMCKDIYINGDTNNMIFQYAITKNANQVLNVHYNGLAYNKGEQLEYITGIRTPGTLTISGGNGSYNAEYNVYYYNNYRP